MTNMVLQNYNSKTSKLKWPDDAKRFILKNSKIMTAAELAEKYDTDETRVIDLCNRIGCGYITKKPASNSKS